MKNIIVLYQSKYGTTKQYAKWIAEELNVSAIERSDIKSAVLDAYDIIIYGGGLYAGGIAGVESVVKNPYKQLVLFTVGLANPATTDYSSILNKNLGADKLKDIEVFHLRGGIDYKKLGVVHKGMMAMLKKMVGKKSVSERTEEDKAMLETYGEKVDFIDRSSIAPIIEYVRAQ